MNILIVPFHDWRKILLEGFRTRDAHFIEELKKDTSLKKVIINRPTTFLEILLKRKQSLIQGQVVLSKSGFKLYEVEENLYLIDFVSKNFVGQTLSGYKWFINQYGNAKYISFINQCLEFLNIANNYCFLSQNVFAYKLTEQLKPKISIFDAWDNFLKFNVYKHLLDEIELGYKTHAYFSNYWITNSKDNIIDFSDAYQPKKMILIKNGVDVRRFVDSIDAKLPEDMKSIPHPIIGFGGKISQLLDVDLINNIIEMSPEISFVFVGQILDKQVFKSIIKRDNFYYLGDKHYDEYPNYVKIFDICIVPYVVDEQKKSGANSIKVYEYLATNKKVIGTNSNGLEDLSDYLYITNTADEFSKEIKNIVNYKDKIILDNHSWDSKIKELLKLIKGA
jgi:glycosyltransferase involved in cell wall biosynthesis